MSTGAGFDREAAARHLSGVWDHDVVPSLTEYVSIPALSPAFDADWARRGELDRAVELVRAWVAARPIPGLRVERHDLPGRTPVLLVEVPATPGAEEAGDVLVYGHVDKQPEMTGWREGLGPWTPVLEGDRLYGRGGADDGYAAFAACAAIESVRAAAGRHGRIVVLIEASEESGSRDLPAHLSALGGRIGDPSLVVCLDSGCGDFERLWTTTSLRGLLAVEVTVGVLSEGVHSGGAGGVVPSSFRVLRSLLDRIEDPATGRVLLPELTCGIPDERVAQARRTASLVDAPAATFPLLDGVRPQSDDPVDQILDRTWRSSVAVVGLGGAPSPERAGAVLRPSTTAALAVRVPPRCDADAAARALVEALTTDVPHGARVEIGRMEVASGWDAPPTADWLAEATSRASRDWFGEPDAQVGEGGTIPFMAMLGERFPDAQFLITGVLGPGTNAHGPNEFIDLAYAERLTGCVAQVLDAHACRQGDR